MTAETFDDPVFEWLAACDEALAAGSFPSSKLDDNLSTSQDLRCQAEPKLDVLRLLHQVLPRGSKRQFYSADPAQPPPSTLGRFELVRRLGQGGFGTVWLAFDPRLKRHVAIKVPHMGALADEELRRRFFREADAAARLEHPNIVAAYEAGDAGSVCYLISAYCDGPDLALWLKQQDQPVSVRQAVELVVAIADGIDHAHQRGVVHRDLKPSNVLLVRETQNAPTSDSRCLTGNVVPRITDFGLAMLITDSVTMAQTQSGAVVGTPAYMAPEQAAGRRSQIGPAADLWSLGVILYQLLTDRPPFRGETALETMLQIQSEDPVAPSQLRRGLPREVEWICQKCLRKEPDQRYASAAQLATELRLFLAGLPLKHTRRIGPFQRSVMWCRRHRVVVSLMTALVVSLVGGLTVSLRFAWKASDKAAFALTQQGIAHKQTKLAIQEATNARQKEAEAVAAKQISDRNLCLAHMQLCQQAWDEGAMDRLRQLLEHQRPEWNGGIDYRGFEWHYWWRCLHSDLLTIPASPYATFVDCSADGSLLANGVAEGVRIWDSKTGKDLRFIPLSLGDHRIAFGKKAQLLAVSVTQAIKLFDPLTGKELHSIPTGQYSAQNLTINSDGTRVAAMFYEHGTSADYGVKVWNVTSGQVIRSFPKATCCAFSPNGTRFACAQIPAQIHIFDAAQDDYSKELKSFPGNANVTQALAFNHDGTQIALAGYENVVRILEVETGKVVRYVPIEYFGANIAFSQDGKKLAVSGSLKNNFVLWSTKPDGDSIQIIKGHAGLVQSLAFHPDGRQLFSSDYDGKIKVWDTDVHQGVRTFWNARAPIEGLSISVRGHRFAVTADGAVNVWETSIGRRLATFRSSASLTLGVLSPDGQTVAGLDTANTIRLWDVDRLAELNELAVNGPPVTDMTFGSEGQSVILRQVVEDHARDTRTNTPLTLITHKWNPHSNSVTEEFQIPLDHAFNRWTSSADGRRCVAMSPDRICAWDCSSGEQLLSIPWTNSQAFSKFAISPDGEQLAFTILQSPIVQVVDVATGKVLFSRPGFANVVQGMAFSPDGRRLATGDMSGAVKIWDHAGSGESVLALKSNEYGPNGLIFSADGLTLFGGCGGHVFIWDASPIDDATRRESIQSRNLTYQRERARESLRLARWQDSLVYLEMARSEQPGHVQDLLGLAEAHTGLEHWDQAVGFYLDAMDRMTEVRYRDSPWSQTCLKIAGHKELFARIISLRPQCDSLWVARARLLAADKQWEKAVEAFRKGLELRDLCVFLQSNDEYFEFPLLLWLAGDRKGCVRSIQKWEQCVGEKMDPMMAFDLARASACLPESPIGAERTTKLAAQAANAIKNAWQIHTLGMAYLRAADYPQARNQLTFADSMGWGGTVVNWLGLAILHHEAGDDASARKWLAKALPVLDKKRDLPMPDWLEALVLFDEVRSKLGE